MIRAIVAFCGVAIGVGGLPGYGQSCPQAVIVNVLNARGLPIPDLPASSFKASSHGKRVTVLSASLRSDPSTRTYVLLDMGTSMSGIGAQGIDKWKIARGAAADFLNVAPPQAEISMAMFSDTVDRKFLSRNERQAMTDWLNGPESLRASGLKGNSAIYRTIVETAKTMQPARPGSSIFLISDGVNDKTFPMTANVDDELESSGIRLFSFMLDDSHPAESGIAAGGLSESVPPPNPDAKKVSELVRRSGGLGYTLYPGGNRVGQSFGVSYEYDERMHQNVRASVSEIEIAISNFYILSLSLPDDARRIEDFQFEVVDAQGKVRKDAIVAFPARIPGCTMATGR